METRTRASDELFRRGPDERFDSLQSLYDHCYATRTNSIDRWQPPQSIQPAPTGGRLTYRTRLFEIRKLTGSKVYNVGDPPAMI